VPGPGLVHGDGDGGIEQAIVLLVSAEQHFDAPAQVRIAATGFIKIGRPMIGRVILNRRQENSPDLLGIDVHSHGPLSSSARNGLNQSHGKTNHEKHEKHERKIQQQLKYLLINRLD
jgi:hypothetical protein